jgi:two-component system sensor histidine kinase/response regulator
VDARDYQGVPIIGVIKAIPLTDWFLIVKLDREEMYGPAREDATWVILLGAMGLLIAAIAVFLVEQNRSLRLSVLERRQQGEKLQALQQLADQRSRLQTLFEQSRDGIVILDGSGRVSEANGHHAEMLGYSLAEMRDLSVADWDSGWRSEQGAGPTAEASRTDGHFETRYRRKDGSVFDVEVVATSVEWAGQKLMFWVCRDISERKRIEAQLRKLSLAVEQSPNSIVIMDVSGRIEYVNAAFTVISGYAPEEAPDHNPYLIGPDGTATSTHVALWQRLAQGETWQGQFQNRRKTGEEYDEFARLSPIRQPGGRLTHYLAIGEDITDKKRLAIELDRHRHHLEELVHQRTLELAAARDVAESANRAKSLFLANMSHEIRTPMNAIMGLTHLLQRSARDPDQREKLKKVGDTAHHLLQILNDILDLSKIEAGKLVLERIEFELDTVLNNVCSLVAERAKAKELELVVEIDPHLSCARVLRGDPTRLTQLLLNYLGNAVKFTERGSVTLRGRIQEENAAELLLRFEVEDTGPGIAPNVLSRLFAMFEQADGSTTRRHGGTGLGLAINQRLARLMGGEAGATSVFGVGSTFWCTVRIGKSSRPPTRRLMSANLRERRVLVVDDLPEARLALSDMLQAMGMRADIAQIGGRRSLGDCRCRRARRTVRCGVAGLADA